MLWIREGALSYGKGVLGKGTPPVSLLMPLYTPHSIPYESYAILSFKHFVFRSSSPKYCDSGLDPVCTLLPIRGEVVHAWSVCIYLTMDCKNCHLTRNPSQM